MVNGTEYGETREYGLFSFTRMYEAGHTVSFYQPLASLELFRRHLGNLVIADGSEAVYPDSGTKGKASATHTEPFVAVTSLSSAAAAGSSMSALASQSLGLEWA